MPTPEEYQAERELKADVKDLKERVAALEAGKIPAADANPSESNGGVKAKNPETVTFKAEE